MNWFFRWLYGKLRNADMCDQPYPVPCNEVSTGPSTDGMNIKVWAATGGHIVEFRKYDQYKDRNESKMYIIPTEQNFSESLTKIITMEMMR